MRQPYGGCGKPLMGAKTKGSDWISRQQLRCQLENGLHPGLEESRVGLLPCQLGLLRARVGELEDSSAEAGEGVAALKQKGQNHTSFRVLTFLVLGPKWIKCLQWAPN
ncbi:hypothetical protein V6N12_013998 [Hibiscus sabdariffa]|uniref:Uncharacterized protein n=1 Tax=Hibiscus sabdariffa TaxID=183260 RepID=A0ABR2BF86_9ROSI